jgi:flagellin-like hook-associated protein FlgL
VGLSVATNVAALNTYGSLARSDQAMQTSLRRLSTGLRITTSADDAAGLSISEGLRSQISGMRQAVRNAQDGIGVVRTAEGALGETTAILQRLRDLAVQSANTGALDGTATTAIRREAGQLYAEIDRIAHTTTFNRVPLLDGSFDRVFQVGANAGDTIRVTIPANGLAFDVAGLQAATVLDGSANVPNSTVPAVSAAQGTPAPGRLTLAGDYVSAGSYANAYRSLKGTVSSGNWSLELGSVDYTGAVTAQDHLDRLNAAVAAAPGMPVTPFTAGAGGLVLTGQTPGPGSTAADAEALTPTYTGWLNLDAAIRWVSQARGHLGTTENRLDHVVSGLTTTAENLTASESRIRDADMAAEMTTFTRAQILTQAGTAMLGQANRSAQSVLVLLG